MQSKWLCIHTGRRFEVAFENMPLLMQAIWGYIWKRTVEKSQITWPADLRIHFKSHSGEKSIDAASVIMHPLEQATLGTTWKRTIEFSSVHSKSLRLLLIIHSGEKSNQCNQCHFVCCDPSALRQGFWHLQKNLVHQKYQWSAKYV